MMKTYEERYQALIDDMELREKMINEIIEVELASITEEQKQTLVTQAIKSRWRVGSSKNIPIVIMNTHHSCVVNGHPPNFYWIKDRPDKFTYEPPRVY